MAAQPLRRMAQVPAPKKRLGKCRRGSLLDTPQHVADLPHLIETTARLRIPQPRHRTRSMRSSTLPCGLRPGRQAWVWRAFLAPFLCRPSRRTRPCGKWPIPWLRPAHFQRPHGPETVPSIGASIEGGLSGGESISLRRITSRPFRARFRVPCE